MRTYDVEILSSYLGQIVAFVGSKKRPQSDVFSKRI